MCFNFHVNKLLIAQPLIIFLLCMQQTILELDVNTSSNSTFLKVEAGCMIIIDKSEIEEIAIAIETSNINNIRVIKMCVCERDKDRTTEYNAAT